MSNFTPTAGQAEALSVIRGMTEKFPGGGGLAVISGPAGVGKSTLLKVLAEEVPGLFVLTPTGKAAVRVKEVAGCDALTIHRWLYTPDKDEETGEYNFVMKEAKDLVLPPNRTLIIDEASMVTSQVFAHLHFFAKTLALNMVLIGDGFQLPPVERDSSKRTFSVFSDDFPADIKVNITEILRQALENPIIRIGNDIRVNADIMSSILSLSVVTGSKLDQALLDTWNNKGVVICHRNQTRHELNNKMRALCGLPEGVLMNGEPLLVTKNNYDLNVFNGEVFTIGELGRRHLKYPVVDRRKNKTIYMEFQEVVFDDIDCRMAAAVSPEEIFGKSADMDLDVIKHGCRQAMCRDYPELRKDDRPKYVHTNLGYVLTGHRSQGSEWPEVLVIMEPSVRLSTVEGRRWLYTTLSRSREKVQVHWMD